MNFKTYLEILKSEGLEESPVADGLLFKAVEAQGQIDRYATYDKNEVISKEIRRLEQIKLESIWGAIDLAREYPPESDMYKLSVRAFRRTNKRQYKGFMNEYRLMKHQPKNKVKNLNFSNLSPIEKRVNDRWERAMKG